MMIMESPSELAGYPLLSSTIVPDGPGSPTVGTLLFGVGRPHGRLLERVRPLVNPYETTAYSKGNVQIRGIITVDVAVRHIESFAAAVDVNLT